MEVSKFFFAISRSTMDASDGATPALNPMEHANGNGSDIEGTQVGGQQRPVGSWYLYQMVTQNMLRTHDGKWFYSEKKKSDF